MRVSPRLEELSILAFLMFIQCEDYSQIYSMSSQSLAVIFVQLNTALVIRGGLSHISEDLVGMYTITQSMLTWQVPFGGFVSTLDICFTEHDCTSAIQLSSFAR